jgi:uncharacterized protein YkwD
VKPLLCQVARQHTLNMAKQEKMDHQLDNRSLSRRVADAGYAARVVGENNVMADRQPDDPPPPAEDVQAMWMKSKGHRANILDPDYAEVGVSMARSKKGVYFCSMVFAVPLPPAVPPEGGKETRNRVASEKELIDLVNQARARAKLSQLVVNPLLTKAAKQHTENMAKQEKMEHELDGKTVKHRVVAAGYDYHKVGENLARALSDDKDDPPPPPADIHNGWMNSKSHRAHILDPKYTEVGVSIGRSKKGTYFYTMVFAVPER